MNPETDPTRGEGQPELCSTCRCDLCTHCAGCPARSCGTCDCRQQDPQEVAAAGVRLCRDCQEPLRVMESGQHLECEALGGAIDAPANDSPDDEPEPTDLEQLDYPETEEPTGAEIDRSIHAHARWLEEVG